MRLACWFAFGLGWIPGIVGLAYWHWHWHLIGIGIEQWNVVVPTVRILLALDVGTCVLDYLELASSLFSSLRGLEIEPI